MASFSKDNFIVPGFEISKNLKLRNISNIVVITITNNTGAVFYTQGSNVLIKTTSEANIIILDFATNVEATLALNKLKNAYSLVVENKKKADSKTDPLDVIYHESLGNIVDGQTTFQVPPNVEIFTVAINGVNITTYDYNIIDGYIVIDIVELGYGIESDDEIIIKYFNI